ncbi:MAG TPA: methionyl aminopeptidase [Candidatus Avacidaminococcus intestinavium]|uniref:Methionine aminopeptidase n=1 Tax=Candidatus Avacidaminococcus intestinavium TaxID=2840684 RepID=A0A9D1MPI3_9FIRM|nr:methionyl aminopeptidase [Candidatus Avacidaminococcus intestinavium]
MSEINELCWCGSGKKHLDCHLPIEEKIEAYKAKGYEVPTRDMLKTPAQIAGIIESAKINTGVLDYVEKQIKVGMSTEQIDELVYDYTVKHGAIPAPLNFMGFPKSCCTSINEEVCHGIPDKNIILKSGDIINVDVSTIYKGYYSDASRMFMVGRVDKKKQDLVAITKECLKRGIAAAQPWNFIGDIGAAVTALARKHGYSVVREFGGHGVGVEFHEEPFVCHYGKRKTGMLLVPGMIFTIEPMINMGKRELYIDAANDWTAITMDGLPSAQWEHTVLITEDGPVSLTY